MAACGVCGKELRAAPDSGRARAGRPRRYCSRACQGRAYRMRVAAAGERADAHGAAEAPAAPRGPRRATGPGPGPRPDARPAEAPTGEDGFRSRAGEDGFRSRAGEDGFRSRAGEDGFRPRTGDDGHRPRAGENSRARVLAAALEAFARTGYRGTSLEVVADAAGLTRAGLLHHFPSKRALLLAVLTERDEQDLRAFGRPLESLAGIEVLDFLDDLARLNTNRRGLVQLAHVLGAEAFDPGHPAHLYFRDRLRRIRTELTAALRRGVAAGTVREDVDCDRVVEQTIAVMEGLEALWLQDPDATDLAEAFRSYSEGLRRAMTRG